MTTLLEIKTTILPGGRIEVQVPGLAEGQEVVVRIVALDETSPNAGKLLATIEGLRRARLAREDRGVAPKRRMSEILADYPGGELFKSAEEVDRYLEEERDSWGD